jgi:tRNA (guanosine-2'-O-)-methyltransferase
MMIRSAVLFGAEKFYIVGKKRYDKRSTVGAHNYIDLQFIECDPETDPYVCLDILKKDYNVFLIEQGGTNINHMDFGSYDKSCFVFGTESNGIPQAILDLNLSRCSIHQIGVLRSLNVSAAASIVMHKVATDLERKLK